MSVLPALQYLHPSRFQVPADRDLDDCNCSWLKFPGRRNFMTKIASAQMHDMKAKKVSAVPFKES